MRATTRRNCARRKRVCAGFSGCCRCCCPMWCRYRTDWRACGGRGRIFGRDKPLAGGYRRLVRQSSAMARPHCLSGSRRPNRRTKPSARITMPCCCARSAPVLRDLIKYLGRDHRASCRDRAGRADQRAGGAGVASPGPSDGRIVRSFGNGGGPALHRFLDRQRVVAWLPRRHDGRRGMQPVRDAGRTGAGGRQVHEPRRSSP